MLADEMGIFVNCRFTTDVTSETLNIERIEICVGQMIPIPLIWTKSEKKSEREGEKECVRMSKGTCVI